jgi:hypothetical protein
MVPEVVLWAETGPAHTSETARVTTAAILIDVFMDPPLEDEIFISSKNYNETFTIILIT